MHDLQDYSNHIATRVHAAEAVIDAAIAELSMLTHDMTRHRSGNNLAARVGQTALTDALAAAVALGEARARLVSCHSGLDRTAKALGLEITAGGPIEGKSVLARSAPSDA